MGGQVNLGSRTRVFETFDEPFIEAGQSIAWARSKNTEYCLRIGKHVDRFAVVAQLAGDARSCTNLRRLNARSFRVSQLGGSLALICKTKREV